MSWFMYGVVLLISGGVLAMAIYNAITSGRPARTVEVRQTAGPSARKASRA